MGIKKSPENIKFSISISVYKNDNPEYFIQALNSIISQTIKPSEIVLVVDGPVTKSIDKVIEQFEKTFENFKTVRLKENKGHATARQIGIENTQYDIVALMDSDDISVPNRFEKQLSIFKNDKKLSVLGGQIHEFIDSTYNVVGLRNVPLDDAAIKSYLKSRCPMNQVTVMFRKSAILAVGGYIDWHYEEDYYLWIRMVQASYKFQNLPLNLVNVRVGKEMYNRRGGYKYFKSEAKLQTYMWKHKIISFPRYIFNVVVRLIVQVLLPNNVRGYIFQKLFRKSK